MATVFGVFLTHFLEPLGNPISHPRFQGDMGWIGWGSGKEDQERPPRAFNVLVGWFWAPGLHGTSLHIHKSLYVSEVFQQSQLV